MYKRFWTICIVVGAALLVLSVVGLSSLGVHERGLRAERQGQFVAVAEQIRFDVKSKLDVFLQTEQQRPYTDFQYAYVPETTNQAEALVRSPLADSLAHGLAFGYFQIDAAGSIVTPYTQSGSQKQFLDPALAVYLENLKTRVLVSLNGQGGLPVRRIELGAAETGLERGTLSPKPVDEDMISWRSRQQVPLQAPRQVIQQQTFEETQTAQQGAQRSQTYRIESFENTQTQTMQQSRGTFERNIYLNKNEPEMTTRDNAKKEAEPQQREAVASRAAALPEKEPLAAMPGMMMKSMATGVAMDSDTTVLADKDAPSTVQIRIEPFTPLIVPEGPDAETIFPGQIFLVRHVQIENTHMLQGFRLNETELAEQVQESARRLVRTGMGVELAQAERADAAHTAILDFGFGELVLNLLEQDPGWIAAKVARLNRWMAAILAVVWLAVLLAMLALWRNLNEQVKLARKKDDFISAVSHELRTPLTSIRMYTEMLEKDWVKDDAKRREYYGTMRQETERLTRLIENVLDFSRIQRGKKNFDFTIGDVNGCIRDVVEMMRPCADRAGFVIETNLYPIEPFPFDKDAVTQIVINLIDNALKYARQARDKRIFVRTHSDDWSAIIEVEDHGPGIPKSQQKRIFEAFYRCGDEATRQTTGTGLGLALVKRFAEAHHGIVEILTPKPAGALFRIRIAR